VDFLGYTNFNYISFFFKDNKNLFRTNIVLQEQLLAEEVIPRLITDDINAILTMLPSHKEIKVDEIQT
jgi:hypothetical protein